MSPVTRVITAGLLALGLVPGLLSAPGAVPAAHAVEYKHWGRAAAPDQELRRGCHDYRYHYRVNAPSHDWLIEIFVKSPTGKGLWTDNFTSQAPANDPEKARAHFEVCRASTRPGRHKLKMRVTWYDPDDLLHTPHTAWVRPTYFRLYRP